MSGPPKESGDGLGNHPAQEYKQAKCIYPSAEVNSKVRKAPPAEEHTKLLYSLTERLTIAESSAWKTWQTTQNQEDLVIWLQCSTQLRIAMAQAGRASTENVPDDARVLQAIEDGFTTYSIPAYLGMEPVAVMQILYKLESNGKISRNSKGQGWVVL
jgi:hypothetical protein